MGYHNGVSTRFNPTTGSSAFPTLDPALKRGRTLQFERRVTLLSLLAGLPAVALCALLLWLGDYSTRTQLTIDLFLVLGWLVVAFKLKERIVRPLQTLSNILAALREGDYSLRGRRAAIGDALGEVMLEVNELGQTLREQRLGALEATALLRTVMSEIDVAVFAFDGKQRLRLVNRSGEKLLAQRWSVRQGTFREGGVSHQLLVLADLSQTLREEERVAWQRLLRVLGHELNNSLAPIKSVAGSLADLLRHEHQGADWRDDMQRGLGVISSRADSLARFIESYSKVARLPQPKFEPVHIGDLVRRVASLETRSPVNIVGGPEIIVQGDSAQLEQLLINLLRNAVDAAQETEGRVEAGWVPKNGQLEVWIRDDGPGVANTANLFVPFFTTKAGGSGIGLVLSRQIAEAHGGALTLENRAQSPGCEARLRLPL